MRYRKELPLAANGAQWVGLSRQLKSGPKSLFSFAGPRAIALLGQIQFGAPNVHRGEGIALSCVGSIPLNGTHWTLGNHLRPGSVYPSK